MNICNNFFCHNKDSTALIGANGYTVTYGELDTISSEVAHELSSLGFTRGSRIMLRGDNSPEMAILWVAAVRSGGAALFLSNAHTDDDASAIYIKASCTHALDQSEIISLVAKSRECTRPNFGVVDVDPEEVCEITLTSGTSGAERQSVVPHSHQNTLWSMQTGIRLLEEPTPSDVFYGSPHLSFAYGVSALMIVPLMYGASTVLVKRSHILGTLKLIAAHNVTYFFSGPAFYSASIHSVGNMMRSVRFCVTAGELASPDLRRRWEDNTGIYMTDVFGCAEGQFIIAASSKDITPLECVGRIASGYTIIADNDKLTIKTPYSTFTTNDSGRVVGDLLYIYGRTDDVIITTDGKFHPSYIEDVCMSSGVISDVFALSEKKHSINIIMIYCVVKDDIDENIARIKITETCTSKLIPSLQPYAINFVSKLPRTLTGKAQRNIFKNEKELK